MNDLRERFRDLDHRLSGLDMPDLLSAAESRAPAVMTEEPRQSRPRLRASLVGVAAVLVLGSATVAWAYFASSAQDTVSIQCIIAGVSDVIPSASGNPVTDCAAEWKRDTGTAAPHLVAYDNQHGAITVIPAADPPPPGWTLLPQGATQNASMVEMQQWLDDYVTGLNSGCYDNATALEMTELELQRLGMGDWTVRPAPSEEVSSACVSTAILEPATSTVELRAFNDPPDPAATYVKLAVDLRSIADRCDSLGSTARQVRSAAARLGLSEKDHEYELTEVRNDAARCTTIYEDVGGSIFVVLRGPST
jgi:hypothetical protein